MDQSTLVVGALLAGFVLYLAANNRLGVYVAILTGRVTAAGTGGAAGTGATNTTGSIFPFSVGPLTVTGLGF